MGFFLCLLTQEIIARFGKQEMMPREFFTDFVKVAQDEGRHFTLLAARLRELGSFYGALPAHDGLWDSAMETSNDLLARLAIEHCVHEVCAFLFLLLWLSLYHGLVGDKFYLLLFVIWYNVECEMIFMLIEMENSSMYMSKME